MLIGPGKFIQERETGRVGEMRKLENLSQEILLSGQFYLDNLERHKLKQTGIEIRGYSNDKSN